MGANTVHRGGIRIAFAGAAFLAFIVAASSADAYPAEYKMLPGYHAEFSFSPALDSSSSPASFVAGSGDVITVTATLYDAYGAPLEFKSGAAPLARLYFAAYDLSSSTVAADSFSVDGAVSGPASNVATFTVSAALLRASSGSAAWALRVESPNLLGWDDNGLHIGQGGNCLHRNSDRAGANGLGEGIECARSFYNTSAAAAFSSSPSDAAFLDRFASPILMGAAPSGGGGGGGSDSSGGSQMAGGQITLYDNGPEAIPILPVDPDSVDSPPAPDSNSHAPISLQEPPITPATLFAAILATAGGLFLATTGFTFRGLSALAPVRWATVEQILPPEATSAWIEFMDPKTGQAIREVALQRLEDPESGAVAWAWQGYLRQQGAAFYRIHFRDALQAIHDVFAAPVEATVHLGGVSTPLVPAPAAHALTEVIQV